MPYRWFPRRPASAAGTPGASPAPGSPGTRAAGSQRARCGPGIARGARPEAVTTRDRKSTRLNSSHITISYAVFCLKKKKKKKKKHNKKKKKKKKKKKNYTKTNY